MAGRRQEELKNNWRTGICIYLLLQVGARFLGVRCVDWLVAHRGFLTLCQGTRDPQAGQCTSRTAPSRPRRSTWP